MFCKRCGEPMNDGARFCSSCGKRVCASKPAARPAKKGRPALWAALGALVFVAAVAAGTLVGFLLLGGFPWSGGQAAAAFGSAVPSRARPTKTALHSLPPVITEAPSPTPAPLPTPSLPPPPDPATLPYATIVWYTLGPDTPDLGLVQRSINAYLKAEINAGLDVRLLDFGNYEAEMETLLASGQPADLCFTASWFLNYRQHAESGTFLPLDALLDRYGGGVTAALGRDYLRGAEVNGQIYGLPANAGKCHYYGLLLRKDLVGKYRVDTAKIRRVQDLEPVFAKVKAGEKGVTPLYVDSQNTPAALPDWNALAGYDVPGALPGGGVSAAKVVDQFTAPESLAWFRLMRQYRLKGYTNPSDTSADRYGGKCFASVGTLSPGLGYVQPGMGGVEWVQVPLTRPAVYTGDVTSIMQAIPKTSQNPERTMMFCDMLYTDASLLNTLYYGVEGLHYTKLPGSAINIVSGGGYSPYFSWSAGNPRIAFVPDTQYPDQWREWDRINAEAELPASLGFSFDDTAVKGEVTACKAVYTTYYSDLATGAGAESVDTMLLKFANELENAGAGRIVAEMQRQYEAFLAAGR